MFLRNTISKCTSIKEKVNPIALKKRLSRGQFAENLILRGGLFFKKIPETIDKSG